jgi:hypothetical protein
MNRPAKFNTKAFISFLTVFIWMLLLFTGIVLYFSPPGRVAHWVDWRFLGLLKEEWQAIHTVFAFIFIIIGALHLYYNWVVFWSYLKSKVAGGIKMRRELIWSSCLVMITLLLILLKIPPFQTVMDFGEFLSNSWSNEQTEPPVPHAELLTLSEYADKTDKDLLELTKSLTHLKIQPLDTSMTIEEIAKKNELSPQELIAKLSPTHQAYQQYLGYGRKSFETVCRELGISQEKALQRLTGKDILIKPDEILKEIADRYDMKPVDIINIIKGEESE